jgi:hypothetical protein
MHFLLSLQLKRSLKLCAEVQVPPEALVAQVVQEMPGMPGMREIHLNWP